MLGVSANKCFYKRRVSANIATVEPPECSETMDACGMMEEVKEETAKLIMMIPPKNPEMLVVGGMEDGAAQMLQMTPAKALEESPVFVRVARKSRRHRDRLLRGMESLPVRNLHFEDEDTNLKTPATSSETMDAGGMEDRAAQMLLMTPPKAHEESVGPVFVRVARKCRRRRDQLQWWMESLPVRNLHFEDEDTNLKTTSSGDLVSLTALMARWKLRLTEEQQLRHRTRPRVPCKFALKTDA